MPKTLDITRILREQKEQLRAGFQDRLVMTASITLQVKKTDRNRQIPKNIQLIKIARKLRDARLAPCIITAQKARKIKGLRKVKGNQNCFFKTASL